MLNSKQIIEEGLLKLKYTQGKPAQVGYDLSIKQVNKIGVYNAVNTPEGVLVPRIGKVLKDKTHLTNYTPHPLQNVDGITGWIFYPGV